jgi:hypothetical protein
MRAVRILVSFLVGCAVGAVLHYALYRISLPLQPFIYSAF